MSRRHLEVFLSAAAGAAVASMAGVLIAGGSGELSGPRLALHVATKWLLLGATVWAALGNAKLLGAGAPIGTAWRLFGLGVGAFLAGELGEAVYQFGLGILNPFPSVLDVFYVAGYPLLVAGLLGFVHAYASAGYPMGSPGSRALLAGLVAVAGLALLWPLLAPIVGDEATPLLERLLSAAYPLLDIALLAAVVLLLRGTWRFGGGRAWQVWALVMAGLVVMIAGDLRYAYFAADGTQAVDAPSELLFVLSYLLLALGALKQRELIQA